MLFLMFLEWGLGVWGSGCSCGGCCGECLGVGSWDNKSLFGLLLWCEAFFLSCCYSLSGGATRDNLCVDGVFLNGRF